jgi:hypothetical protein
VSAVDRRCECGCAEPVPTGKRRFVDDLHSARTRKRRERERVFAARALLERERLVVEEICRVDLMPHEALLWVLFPEACQKRWQDRERERVGRDDRFQYRPVVA